MFIDQHEKKSAMIKKVLVANRGEIAVRIIRTSREMGISTVAVFSGPDRKSLHVRHADEAYYIGPAASSESYLNIDKIIDVAKKSGADAIHPGYGFLSENASFSDRCKREGLIFIGPPASAISQMGDKITSRHTMIEAGVPVVPGDEAKIENDEVIFEIAKKVGLPVMLKASSGGGGKGMRLVKDENNLLDAFRAAKSEAREAFGDDTVYIEKYISSPHHIEIQIMADEHGNAVHLFERECSVQRRHQKVVEETPSPMLSEKVRRKMGETAVTAARAVGYVGAGTVEFIVDEDQNFYFLEMNTRLQVEHPVTELVVGVDLVKEQINVANGNKLTWRQEDLEQRGHAIECRIYAEDAQNNFMPSPGEVSYIAEPLGLGVRTDGYVNKGYVIPTYYDPLISKLITWGESRDTAIERMRRALEEYKITGVKHNIRFLERIMESGPFKGGSYNTHFIDEYKDFLLQDEGCDDECEEVALMTAFIDYLKKLEKVAGKQDNGAQKSVSSWREFGKRKSVMGHK